MAECAPEGSRLYVTERNSHAASFSDQKQASAARQLHNAENSCNINCSDAKRRQAKRPRINPEILFRLGQTTPKSTQCFTLHFSLSFVKLINAERQLISQISLLIELRYFKYQHKEEMHKEMQMVEEYRKVF
ncbi:hypothetical protein DBV15_03221 [Temnothorax longispinosus]|uniref:Uncharacterized protein n=1 Tax=Temnothorax longispinosus TaxID=300112 RepID=A0A4S2LAH1_9HYME|nr:hypothetical protein DBV15_03221 [Temnothorax longispinosus]